MTLIKLKKVLLTIYLACYSVSGLIFSCDFTCKNKVIVFKRLPDNTHALILSFLLNAKDINSIKNFKLVSKTFNKFTNNQIDLLLVNSIEQADTEIIKLLLKIGSNPNVQYELGYTALMHAILINNLDVVKILAKNKIVKIDLELENSNGNTALLESVFKKDKSKFDKSKEIANFLIISKANVNHQNIKGETALMLAAAIGSKDLIKLLLDNGANVNIKNNSGHTALKYALKNQNLHTAYILKRAVSKNKSY